MALYDDSSSGQNNGAGGMMARPSPLGSVWRINPARLPKSAHDAFMDQYVKHMAEVEAGDIERQRGAEGQANAAQQQFEQAGNAPTDRLSGGQEFIGRLMGGFSQAIAPEMNGQKIAEGNIESQNTDLKDRQLRRLKIMEQHAERLAKAAEAAGQLTEAHRWSGEVTKAQMQQAHLLQQEGEQSQASIHAKDTATQEARWKQEDQRYETERATKAYGAAHDRGVAAINDEMSSLADERKTLLPHANAKNQMVDPFKARREMVEKRLDELRAQRANYDPMAPARGPANVGASAAPATTKPVNMQRIREAVLKQYADGSDSAEMSQHVEPGEEAGPPHMRKLEEAEAAVTPILRQFGTGRPGVSMSYGSRHVIAGRMAKQFGLTEHEMLAVIKRAEETYQSNYEANERYGH